MVSHWHFTTPDVAIIIGKKKKKWNSAPFLNWKWWLFCDKSDIGQIFPRWFSNGNQRSQMLQSMGPFFADLSPSTPISRWQSTTLGIAVNGTMVCRPEPVHDGFPLALHDSKRCNHYWQKENETPPLFWTENDDYFVTNQVLDKSFHVDFPLAIDDPRCCNQWDHGLQTWARPRLFPVGNQRL